MVDKKLKYTHPAVMKYNVDKTYTLDELQSELSIEMIQILFEPVNFIWSDLEPQKQSKQEEISE